MIKILGLWMVCLASTLCAQPTSFTYQGRLIENGSVANGTYDLRLSVWDSATNGNSSIGITNLAVAVSGGVFTTVADFGATVFDGSARWLEIGVRANGSVGSFTALTPRQAILATPYATRALIATSASSVSNGVYASASQVFTGANQFTSSANSFSGNGGGLTNVNAASIGGVAANGLWQTSGNSNTTAGTSFLGTTDNQALEVKVNGTRALRLEPNGNGVPNLIGGASGNSVTGLGIVIAGGASNKVQSANFAVVSGGGTNSIQTGSDSAVIGGGHNNTIQSTSLYATIAGGEGNTIQASSANSTIGGGSGSVVRAYNGTIGGGSSNLIDTNSSSATVSGGIFHSVQPNSSFATIAGGYSNTIQNNAPYSTIAAGQNNTIGANANNSFAAGRRAKAMHSGSFVWADANNFDFVSTVTNSFSVRAIGGARFVSAIDASGNPTNGVSLAAGSGSWTSLSDRNAKENFIAVDPREILQRVAELPLSTWNYKTQDKSIRHIGPMAQDFAAAFHVGEDERHITTIDEDGVALAAIQGLNQVMAERNAQIRNLQEQNDSLQKRLSDLEQLVKSTLTTNTAHQ